MPETIDQLRRRNNISRERWATAAAEIFLHQWNDQVLGAVIAGGPAKFRRIAGEILRTHDFRPRDLTAIYDRLCRAGRKRGLSVLSAVRH